MKKTPEKKSAASKTKQKVSKPKAVAPKVVAPVVEVTAPKTKAKAAKSNGAPEDKQTVIEKFAQRKGDTGSPEVQIALLTHKIFNLSAHLGENKKDNHSRRGLLKVVAKRRRILNYLQKIDEKRYKKLIGELSLKK